MAKNLSPEALKSVAVDQDTGAATIVFHVTEDEYLFLYLNAPLAKDLRDQLARKLPTSEARHGR